MTFQLFYNSQFSYVGYTQRGYKYLSQVGAILKREYPGIITVYDDDGTIIKQQPAMSWNDYYWKKNEHDVCYAQRVKQVIWVSKHLASGLRTSIFCWLGYTYVTLPCPTYVEFVYSSSQP